MRKSYHPALELNDECPPEIVSLPLMVSFNHENIAFIDSSSPENEDKSRYNALSTCPMLNMFNDGERHIDLVIVYDEDKSSGHTERNSAYRTTFFRALEEEGLELEQEEFQTESEKTAYVVKVHAPFDTLCALAEAERLRLPVNESIEKESQPIRKYTMTTKLARACCTHGERRNPLEIEPCWQYSYDEEARLQLVTPFSHRSRVAFQGASDEQTFFQNIHRIRLVWNKVSKCGVTVGDLQRTAEAMQIESGDIDRILHKQHPMRKNGCSLGVTLGWMISKNMFHDVFALHDGDLDGTSYRMNVSPREWLRATWARTSRFRFAQPLDAIKDYFGEQVAFYYAWLGFYTASLFFPALLGLLVFVFGVCFIPFDRTSKEVCDKFANLTVCRLCHQLSCPFAKVGDACGNARFVKIFDNCCTVLFSLVMSVWAATFLKQWKRREAFLAAHWHVDDVLDTEDVSGANLRPEYLNEATVWTQNKITKQLEIVVPAAMHRNAKILSIIIIGSLICFVIAIVAGTTIYKMVVGVILHQHAEVLVDKIIVGQSKRWISPQMIANVSATTINTICILIFSRIYESIARRLTEREKWRTEKDFEESYTYKMFVFQFINFYAFLFYAAFIQGHFGGESPKSRHTQFVDHCFPHACYAFLSTQLMILFTAKQIVGNIIEVAIPAMQNRWKQRAHRSTSSKRRPWERDYDLSELDRLPLNGEYFEMIVQFGFVTMFVAAFPLAPLLAFINNIFEIRLDAFKFVVEFRRPFPSRVRNTKVWDTLLSFLAHLAVITNALLIAFSTQFVDRVYYLLDPFGRSADSFFHSYMSSFNTNDWNDTALKSNISECWFIGMYKRRVTAGGGVEYVHSEGYYVKMMFKLAFVIVFVAVVYAIMKTIDLIVPNVPREVGEAKMRELYLANEALRRDVAKAKELKCQLDEASAQNSRENIVESDAEHSTVY